MPHHRLLRPHSHRHLHSHPHPRPSRRARVRRPVSAILALFLAAGALLGFAAPAFAEPPVPPTLAIIVPASGQSVDFAAELEPGSSIVSVTGPGAVATTIVPPATIVFSSTAAVSYPSYSSQAQLVYTVERGGEVGMGDLNVTVVHKPWVLPTGSNQAVVAQGQTVQLGVAARGRGFDASGVATSGGYAVRAPGPQFGTASVASDGTVSFTAPANAVPGSVATFSITATDAFGQVGELYTPLSVRIAGTAEADVFSVDVPFEGDPAGTRVEIVPDHARGANPRVTSVTANASNAAVVFDQTGATFAPPAGYAWGAAQTAYIFAAPYTVDDDNGVPANAQINVRVLRPPLLSVDHPQRAVPIGGTASATVRADNDLVIPATGGYRIVQAPSTGAATVDDQGIVAYTAPVDAMPGDAATVRVEVTDTVGQSRMIDVDFVAYVGAHAPDIDGERADAPFAVNLLDGAGGDGKRLVDVTRLSGDATVVADLATGAVAVTPNRTWAAGEASHDIEIAYTIEDAEGATDTGAAAFRVLAPPVFADADSRLRVEAGDRLEVSAAVLAPENLPATGAYAVTLQPRMLAAGAADRAGAAPWSALSVVAPVAVDDRGRVTVDTAGLAAGGVYEFAVRVEDRVGQSAVRTFQLGVASPAEPPAAGGDAARESSLVRTGAEPHGALGLAAALLVVAAAAFALRRRAR